MRSGQNFRLGLRQGVGAGSMMKSELPPKCPSPLYLLRQINAATVPGKKQQDKELEAHAWTHAAEYVSRDHVLPFLCRWS